VGQLGSMAFQSAEGISVARAEVESTTGTATTQALTVTDGSSTKFVVQEVGDVGINSTPVNDANRTSLVIDGVWGGKILNKFGGADTSVWYESTGGVTQFGTTGARPLVLQTNGAERWRIDGSNGNLIANGTAIDFGSGASTTLDAYEEGTWTPTIVAITAGPTAGAGAAYSGTYTRIGRFVHCSVDLDFDAAGTLVAVDDRFTLGSIPFSVIPAVQTYTGVGSIVIYASVGSGANAFGTVGVTQTGDGLLFYVTHVDGAPTYGSHVRAAFTYETDA